ncbi:hypothetical protein DNTS_004753 [Danionella cerebrum]|uniref:Peptide chain release factor 1-like, mitochondrial n=1 Tax=Danionella cerebrum TaxID=2873325 RepID=A0A553R633_9TELE|nr:hypothetical protein DNTS_004753 [Danionella translucida]
MGVMRFSNLLRVPLLRTILTHSEVIKGSVRKFTDIYFSKRAFHLTQPVNVAKILSVEDIFNMKSFQDYLKDKEKEYKTCLNSVSAENHSLGDNDIKMKRAKVSDLSPLILKIKELGLKEKELLDMNDLLKENDPELNELAEMEKETCLKTILDLRQKILSLLLHEEDLELSELVLEVSAGVGGLEAMLFTAEIFSMYQNYSAFNGWTFQILESGNSEIGGIRHASASITGPLSYKKLRFEAGVHRVQRIPKTESKGRIHTSTMTVAILPQPTEIALTINPKDLKIETKRASGAGGQHVNTTDSAVRITHLPTGTVAESQNDRSQIKNKEIAMKLLRAKLYSAQLEEETNKRYQTRKLQIGTKGRSEKIRTYNFLQDRITDHRISKTMHNMEEFLQGEELLDEMVVLLQVFSEQESLMDIVNDYKIQ